MKYYAGIDLGGTNIKAGIVDEERNIVGRSSTPTKCPRSAELIADDMAEMTRQAASGAGISVEDLEWIGVGAPGSVNYKTGIIEYAGNLNFHDVPMEKMIGDRLQKPVYIGNDANAATYGEALAGAAKGVLNVIGLTLGTGIGGGIVIDKKIYTGHNCCAAELGHMVIVNGGRNCTCGRKGCFEAYASITGLIATTKEFMEQDKSSLMWEMSNASGKVSGRTSFDAMRRGDKSGALAVERFISHLACGVVNYVNIFQPDVLFIGGAISNESETLLAPLRELVSVEQFTITSGNETKIVKATLGNDAGIIGAAFLGNMAEW